MFRKLSNKTKSPKWKSKLKSKSKLSQSSSSEDDTNDTTTTTTASANHTPPQNETAQYLESLKDPEVIERVRVTIKQAHVFKLPTRQTVSVGWRGADWKDKVWQGNVKVVERGGITAVLLVDESKDTIFAVCPVGGDGMLEKGAVDRCVDSSRYFVLRIQNENGRNMFIGVAFNERTDAFDFNAALEDSRKERRNDWDAGGANAAHERSSKDYSLKDGEKIRVAIPRDRGNGSSSTNRDRPNNLSIYQSGDKGIATVGGGTQAFDDFYQLDTTLMDDEEDENDDVVTTPDRSSGHIIGSHAHGTGLEKEISQHDENESREVSSLSIGGTLGSMPTTKVGFLKPSSKDTPSRSKRAR